MLCISAVSVVTSPFSFLILLIWVLSFFFLMSLANGLSILFIFSKNQLLVLLIFAIIFFLSISFISSLIFMISFLLLTLGFVCSSFSSSFRCKVRLFIWDVSCFFFFFKGIPLFFKKLFIYLFLAVLRLRFCARAFSSCGERGPLFIAVRGPLIITLSLVAEHRLQTRRLSSCGSWA